MFPYTIYFSRKFFQATDRSPFSRSPSVALKTGVALFNQRITMALTIISDAAEANKVIAAVKDRGDRRDR